MLIQKYIDLMAPIHKVTVKSNIKIGFAFGVSQFSMFSCMAGMFYGAGVLLENVEGIKNEDVFVALFSIMFGAW